MDQSAVVLDGRLPVLKLMTSVTTASAWVATTWSAGLESLRDALSEVALSCDGGRADECRVIEAITDWTKPSPNSQLAGSSVPSASTSL